MRDHGQNTGDSSGKQQRYFVAVAAPRGVHKRRPEDDDVEEQVRSKEVMQQELQEERIEIPTTPARARIAPEHMPLGLDRSDFHDVHLQSSHIQRIESNYTLTLMNVE